MKATAKPHLCGAGMLQRLLLLQGSISQREDSWQEACQKPYCMRAGQQGCGSWGSALQRTPQLGFLCCKASEITRKWFQPEADHPGWHLIAKCISSLRFTNTRCCWLEAEVVSKALKPIGSVLLWRKSLSSGHSLTSVVQPAAHKGGWGTSGQSAPGSVLSSRPPPL